MFDVYRKGVGEILLVDFNPFSRITDGLLFEWDELLGESPSTDPATADHTAAAKSSAADAPDAAAGPVAGTGEAPISFIASGYGSRTDYDAAVAAGADNDTLWAGDDDEPPLEGLAKVFAALGKPKADPVVPAYYAQELAARETSQVDHLNKSLLNSFLTR